MNSHSSGRSNGSIDSWSLEQREQIGQIGHDCDRSDGAGDMRNSSRRAVEQSPSHRLAAEVAGYAAMMRGNADMQSISATNEVCRRSV
jgi:hypothetical protein